MITKMVAYAAIALGLSVLGAAPANAGSDQSDTDAPNPFGGVTCNCQPQVPPVGPDMSEVERGLRAALAG